MRLNILYQEKGEKGLIWLNVFLSLVLATLSTISSDSPMEIFTLFLQSAPSGFQKLKSDPALAFSICSHFSSLAWLIQIGFFHVQLFTRRTLFFVFVHWPLRCNVQSLPDKVFKIKLCCLVRRRTSTLTFKQYNIIQCHIMQCNGI